MTREDIDFIKMSLVWIGALLFIICLFTVSIAIDVAQLKG